MSDGMDGFAEPGRVVISRITSKGMVSLFRRGARSMRRRLGLSGRVAGGAAVGLAFRSDANDAEVFLCGVCGVPVQGAVGRVLRAGRVLCDVGEQAGMFCLL